MQRGLFNKVPAAEGPLHVLRGTGFDSLAMFYKIEMQAFLHSAEWFSRRTFKPKWRNWQTRMVQVHVPARVWGFESLLRHQFINSLT